LKKELETSQVRIVHAVGRRKEIRQLEQASLSREKTIEVHQSLLVTSIQYKAMINQLSEQLNLLPPSGAMAGIYTMMDNTRGVFKSPANVSIGSAIKPSVNISSSDQEDLNVPINGKAVNAIRTFPGKGVLVWGARTLDGNSNDWRYISVRRTLIFLEQSIKNALEAYVFEPNDANTWSAVDNMISNFLTNFWRQGGLAGAKLEDAFSVRVGLGTTMTAVDILEGFMKVSIAIAVVRPAEFIVFTIEQKMQTA
jgi:phage tail sheath protein FI